MPRELPGEAARRDERATVLRDCGATDALVEELLEYSERAQRGEELSGAQSLPLPDAPHIEAWERYEARAEVVGLFAALRETFAQLRFPVREGISQEDEYRAATRRGVRSDADASEGLLLERPEALELRLHPTLGGRIPTLAAATRADFEALVRAFTERNEPAEVPASMGACLVSGLNNWERIAQHRQRWESENTGPFSGSWSAEFERLKPLKELYQDRFIILSSGPYSAVSAEHTGMDEEAWRRASVSIRRVHECAHYQMLRITGRMADNLLDEVVADLAGLSRTFGEYDVDLARRFFGLEAFPEFRAGGRLENYLGSPPVGAEAVAVLRTLVHRATGNLGRLTRLHAGAFGADLLDHSVLALSCMTLEDLASDAIEERFTAEFERWRASGR